MRPRAVIGGRGSAACLALGGTLVLAAPAPAAVDGYDRMLGRFVEDAAVVPAAWVEGSASAASHRSGERYAIGPNLAFTVAGDFELGLQVAAGMVDPDTASSETGITDLQVWGKGRVMEVPFTLTIGAAVTFPTGEEEDGLGVGEESIEVFVGLRQSLAALTWTAHAGVRWNQDSDVPFDDGFFPLEPGPADGEGEVSFLAGFGLIFPLGERWRIHAEMTTEEARYATQGTDTRLWGGVSYRARRATYRGGLQAGMSAAAPDVGVVAGVALRF